MTKEVKVKDDTVILDTEVIYSGLKDIPAEEKNVRKALSLPVKKGLVYYKNKCDAESVIGIKKYQLIEMFDITEPWYTVEITLEDDSVIRIHSWYLADMQKPSFVADMIAQNS